MIYSTGIDRGRQRAEDKQQVLGRPEVQASSQFPLNTLRAWKPSSWCMWLAPLKGLRPVASVHAPKWTPWGGKAGREAGVPLKKGKDSERS